MRSDPSTPSARQIDESLIEDHLASFLADLGGTLSSLDLDGAEQKEGLRDGTAIQRAIAARHGVQRARLGWSGAELRREYVILREEVAAAVRRRVEKMPPAMSESEREELRRAQGFLDELLARAERLSVESYRRAGDAARIHEEESPR